MPSSGQEMSRSSITDFDGEARKVELGKFRYSLVFRVRGDEIQALAVIHISRKPGYWKNRLQNWE